MRVFVYLAVQEVEEAVEDEVGGVVVLQHLFWEWVCLTRVCVCVCVCV